MKAEIYLLLFVRIRTGDREIDFTNFSLSYLVS